MNTALVLAAGLGTRMRPLTQQTAKPLLHFRGERLLERHLRRLAASGYTRAVINTSWCGRQLRQRVGDGSRYGLDAVYSCEGETPLETASGIARAAPLLPENEFLLVNGDIWTDLDFSLLRTQASTPCIVLVPNPCHNRQGDFALSPAGKVRNTGADKVTYSGVARLDKRAFTDVARSGGRLGDNLRQWAEHDVLSGRLHRGEWYDVGTPQALRGIATDHATQPQGPD